jgi:hypothetical protein
MLKNWPAVLLLKKEITWFVSDFIWVGVLISALANPSLGKLLQPLWALQWTADGLSTMTKCSEKLFFSFWVGSSEVDHNSGAFYLIMALLIGFGILGTVVYYFFRFGFKTDFDKDLDRVAQDEPSEPEQIAPAKDDIISEAKKQIVPKQEPELAEGPDSIEPVGQVKSPQPTAGETESAPPSEAAMPAAPAPEKPAATKDMSQVMEKTRQSFFSRLKSVFSSEKGLEGEDLEDLEEILYTSDLGPQTVQRLMDAVEEHLSGADKSDLDKVVGSLKSEMAKIFSELHWFWQRV